MKKIFLYIISALVLSLAACAPKVAYQAQNSLQDASREASCQAEQTRQEKNSLHQDSYKMKGDIKKVKEAERLFDKKSGIVLTY